MEQDITKAKKTRRSTEKVVQNDCFAAWFKADTGLVMVREYRFHPKRMWRFDYAVPSHKVAVEVEGGVWTRGRHTRSVGFLGDMEKYNAAAIMGWRLLRVTPDMLYHKSTLEIVRVACLGPHDGTFLQKKNIKNAFITSILCIFAQSNLMVTSPFYVSQLVL